MTLESSTQMRRIASILCLIVLAGCAKPAQPPSTPGPPLPMPVFTAVEIAALDLEEQPIAQVKQGSEYVARLAFRLQDGSPPVDGLMLKLVKRGEDGDLIFDESYRRVQRSATGESMIEAKFRATPPPGQYEVVAMNGVYIVARAPLQVVDE